MARKGCKPAEVANTSERGEVPHGRTVWTTHAVLLRALRNNRNLPDARARAPHLAFSRNPAEGRCGPTASVGFPVRLRKPVPGRDDVQGTASAGRLQPPKGFGIRAARGIRRCFGRTLSPSATAMVAGDGGSTAVALFVGFRPACQALSHGPVIAPERGQGANARR